MYLFTYSSLTKKTTIHRKCFNMRSTSKLANSTNSEQNRHGGPQVLVNVVWSQPTILVDNIDNVHLRQTNERTYTFVHVLVR